MPPLVPVPSSRRRPPRLVASLLATAALLLGNGTAWARKTNEPLYEDPFDLGAGGASLTRASKEGVLFSNPALLGLGGGLIRWIGLTTTLLVNKESVTTGQQIAKNAKGGGSSSSSQSQASQLVDDVFKNPIHVGWGLALSVLLHDFGVAAFSRFEPDIRARQFGATGLPEVELRTESYHGAIAGGAIQTPWRWLSFGLAVKHVYAGEQDIVIGVDNAAELASFENPKAVQDFAALNTGTGADASMLVFLQGPTVDFSLAGKVDDIGGTKLVGKSEQPKSFKQVTSVGLGLTLHTTADAVHFAADYRDLADAYGEALFKRVYLGTKLLLHNHLGLAAGYYNGFPSVGAEMDLFFFRIAATAYTRELGDHPGVDPRHIYMASLSLGF